jgi:hypothetical protein
LSSRGSNEVADVVIARSCAKREHIMLILAIPTPVLQAQNDREKYTLSRAIQDE